MKNRAFSLLASIVLLSFASCTDEMQELANEQSPLLKQIVMTTQDFQPEAGSRTVYQIADGAVNCTWAANDTVGVFPDKGAQAYFPMASGAGTKNATFDGEGWALKDGRTYGAYYPFVGAMYLDRNAVPVSYVGQTQMGNASMEHLGTYDYMVATPTAPEFGSAQFMFKHISALVQLKLTIPQPTTLTSVKLVTDTKAFAVEGTMDIMADAPSITPATSSTEVVLNLQDVATTKENEVVTFYFMLPPADLSGKTLKAVLASDKGNVEVVLESKHFKSGTAYVLSGEIESTEAGYKDGVVTISEAGTMRQLLGDDFLNITSLKVVGPINGDDVRCLRQMLGGSDGWNDVEKGKLASLDLSDASIEEGGNWYYMFSSSYLYFNTSNDMIGDQMFRECENLHDIVLPDGVTSIGKDAFYYCSSLTSVTMGKSVTSIGESAFSYCRSLISIEIPAGVTFIDEAVFYDCTSLKAVTMGDGVTSIGEDAFYYCSSLTSVTMGKSVTSIGESAFRACKSLVSIDLPDSVISIGASVFSDCRSLTSIDIPDGVTSIGAGAFGYCSSLSSIELPVGVTSIGMNFFSGCSSLKSVTIGDKVTNIGWYAFKGCSSLVSIDIPDDVTSIGQYAFYDCTSLASVTIGKGVTSVSVQSFRNCSSLTQVYCEGTTPPTINSSSTNSSFNGSSDKRTLYVPKGYSSAYQSSSWVDFFGTIQEME